jgi:diguanylate cyclase (GGDEF)-like protein
MILEDTDLEAALLTANRLRTEIKKLVFDSDQGPFSITISMGVGYWPEDADHKQELIELTDQALYYSKQNGRDRVTAHQHMIRKAS